LIFVDPESDNTHSMTTTQDNINTNPIRSDVHRHEKCPVDSNVDASENKISTTKQCPDVYMQVSKIFEISYPKIIDFQDSKNNHAVQQLNSAVTIDRATDEIASENENGGNSKPISSDVHELEEFQFDHIDVVASQDKVNGFKKELDMNIKICGNNVNSFASINDQLEDSFHDMKYQKGFKDNKEGIENLEHEPISSNEISLDDYKQDIYSAYISAYNKSSETPRHSEIFPVCDYRIICQDKLQEIINCHKHVLMTNSTVLKEIITENARNEENVHISSVSSVTMKKLIEFMYTGSTVKESMDIDLLEAAVKYNVISLLDSFKKDLQSILTAKNAIDILIRANKQCINFYKKCATVFIQQHWEEVRISGNVEALKMYPDVLLEILLNITS